MRLADVVPAVGGPDGEQVHARHLRIVAQRPVELSGLLGVGDDASRVGPRDARNDPPLVLTIVEQQYRV